MFEIKIRSYNPTFDGMWDDFVKRSRNGTFLHTRRFLGYHADRFDDCSLVIELEGKIIGVFPAHCNGDMVMSHNGLTFGGLVVGMDQRYALVQEMIVSICRHFAALGMNRLLYKPVPKVFQRYPSEDDLFAIHHIGGRLVRRDLTAVVPASGPWKVSKLRKRGRAKALKHGVEIKSGNFFEEFHILLSANLKKHGAKPVHNLRELIDLGDRCSDQLELLGAFEDDELVAASWLFHFDTAIHTQYLTSSSRGRAMGALDHLLLHVLDLAHERQVAVSFGASSENRGTVVNEGLMAQKEGFGARAQVLDHYEINLNVSELDHAFE